MIVTIVTLRRRMDLPIVTRTATRTVTSRRRIVVRDWIGHLPAVMFLADFEMGQHPASGKRTGTCTRAGGRVRSPHFRRPCGRLVPPRRYQPFPADLGAILASGQNQRVNLMITPSRITSSIARLRASARCTFTSRSGVSTRLGSTPCQDQERPRPVAVHDQDITSLDRRG